MQEPVQRIRQQLAFLAEIDRLKSVMRQSSLIDRSRRENSAEHSWHLALFAVILSEHAVGVDVRHVVKLLLVHDIVEIDAGDVPIHGAPKPPGLTEAAERQAAERIFGLLPRDQANDLLLLWREFEDGRTPAARLARALDRLQPLLLNVLTGGGTWAENGVSEDQVLARYGPVIESAAPALWQEASRLVREHFRGR